MYERRLTGKDGSIDPADDSSDDSLAGVFVDAVCGRRFVENFIIIERLPFDRASIFDLTDRIRIRDGSEDGLLAGCGLPLVQGPHADAHTDAFFRQLRRGLHSIDVRIIE